MSASPQTPAARKAASQQATLASLAVSASEFAGRQLGDMAARMAAALADVSQPGLDTREVYRRVKSGKLLKENAYAFVHLALAAIDAALRAELAPFGPAAAPTAPLALSLVPLQEMDDKLAIGALARPFDILHSEALATLSVRLGLLLGRGVLRADSNPFRPAVLLKALEQAWREFEPDADAHGLIQPLLRTDILFDLAPLYEQLTDALKRKDSQPGSVDAYRIQKTDDAAAARAARAGNRAALAEQLRKLFGDDGGDDGVPPIPDLPGMPSGSGGWRPSGAAGFAVAAAAQAQASGTLAGTAPASMTTVAGFAQAPAGAAAQPAAGFVPMQAPGAIFMPGQAAGAAANQWAGIPIQSLIDAAAGIAPASIAPASIGPLSAGASAAPLLELLARIEPALAPSHAGAPTGTHHAAPPHKVFYLPRLRQSLPRGSLSHGDERTLDLLSQVFETVLLDDSIPPRARELLQLLQVPVLKAALRDKAFFYEEAHPARRLVDLLSRMGWEQHKDADDPMFQAMQRSVARAGEYGAGRDGVVREGAGDEGSFAAAVADLEASIAARDSAEESAQAQVLAAPVASALKQEKMAVATRAARDAVALRLQAGDLAGKLAGNQAGNAGEGPAENTAGVIGGFLEQRWTTVLTFAHTIEDDKPGAVRNATRAMDDLIWSVKPKATQEQRKMLIARLPRLLATLNKWLDAIRWQDAGRLQFFAHLAECHASIVRAPIELSPERQLELAVEAAQQDALRRVELENAAAQQHAEQEVARRHALSPLDGLERGMWMEFRGEEGARKVKLAWVSPLRTLFIFARAGRGEAFSLAADKLAAALHDGRARVLAIDGVVGQVLADAMRQSMVEH